MAAPYVAGAAAVYLGRHEEARPAAVNQALSDATSKGVVTTALTANNHLLYTGLQPRPPGRRPRHAGNARRGGAQLVRPSQELSKRSGSRASKLYFV